MAHPVLLNTGSDDLTSRRASAIVYEGSETGLWATPRAAGNPGSRSHSPTPSLSHSEGTTDPESEPEYLMAGSLPSHQVRLPVISGAKGDPDDGIAGLAGPQHHHRGGNRRSDGRTPAGADHANDKEAWEDTSSSGGKKKEDNNASGDGGGGGDGPKRSSPQSLRHVEAGMGTLRNEKLRLTISLDSGSTLGETMLHGQIAVNILDGHMSREAMGKIIRRDSESDYTMQSWEAIYQILFGNSELVPKSDWEAPIELEEVLVEMRQNIGTLREQVSHEAEKLLPHYKDAQLNVSSRMTHMFIFFLEQTLSSCQQRLRGNSAISLFDPQWPYSRGSAKRESDDSLMGLGDWSRVFHYNLTYSPLSVPSCAPSSLSLTMRTTDQQVFIKQQPIRIQAVLWVDHHVTGLWGTQLPKKLDQIQFLVPLRERSLEPGQVGFATTALLECGTDDSEDNYQGMAIGVDEAITMSSASGDSSDIEVVEHSPSQLASLPSYEEDTSYDSDNEDAKIDEIISRVCDIVLESCGGSSPIGSFDTMGLAVESAVTDFVNELFDELQTLPPVKECVAHERSGSASTSDLSLGGGYGSLGGVGGSGTGRRGNPGSGGGMRNRGTGGNNGPPSPEKGEVAADDGIRSSGFKYGCPFRKHNPARFNIRDHKQCAATGWGGFNGVKRHVRENHKRPGGRNKCQTCKEGFETAELLQTHLKAPGPEKCSFVETRVLLPEDPDDGMSDEVENRLAARGKLKGIKCWKMLYRALFPGEPEDLMPSSEFEPPDETGQNLKIRKRFQDAEPALAQRLTSIFPFPADLERINAVMDAVRCHQEEVFTSHELSLKGAMGKKRASPGSTQLDTAAQGNVESTVGKRRRLHTDGSADTVTEPLFEDNEDWDPEEIQVPGTAPGSQPQFPNNSSSFPQPITRHLSPMTPASTSSSGYISVPRHHVNGSASSYVSGQNNSVGYTEHGIGRSAQWDTAVLVDDSVTGSDMNYPLDDFLAQWHRDNELPEMSQIDDNAFPDEPSHSETR
ncbi:hypothetical protein B0H67DRAFT_646264 [Lasiosphaeris hirsuta]|uniref:C2H2-type domain-containing protein n=1 Tax=Lasiosphaeris hirsuta TaxID=260670 RepID=A0AA40A7N4_9PEZI|nr:hypothetical protein B0H67DRAFT_646264 [Lasiosphaeris hirsuta]